MPPKAGRPRRAPRATARKSVASPPPQQQQQQQQQQSATQDDVALETEKIDNKTTINEPPIVEQEQAPPNDVALSGTETDKTVAQKPPNDVGAEKDGVADLAVAQSDAVLVPSSETLAEPVKEGQEIIVADNNNNINNDNNNINESNNNNNNNGGKGKKVVKRTVKVVKKVIKRVPKKVSKVENLAQVSNPNSAIKACSSGQLNAEVSNSDTKFEEKEKEQGQKVEIDEKKGGSEGEEEKEKGSSLMEIDSNVGGSTVGTDKRVVEEQHGNVGGSVGENEEKVVESVGAVEGRESECRNKNENENENEERDGNVSNVGGREDEGKLFRGELEAMERKKRRKTEIFIGGLDKETKEEDVRKVFAEVGEIVDLTMKMDVASGKSKYAFLRYVSADDAKRALEKFSSVKICGKQCRATPVEGNDTIFLGNIDKKWKDEDVVKLLQKIGIEKVDNVTLMIDPNNNKCNRGFAFIEFESSKDAQNAYRKLQKKDVFGKNRNIKVAWAEPLNELDEEEMLKVKTVYAEFIPSSWDEEKVRDTFKKFGEIDDIVLARNLRTTKRKDFAFISYKNREAAIKCIESFSSNLGDEDGTKVNVKVSLAKPMQKNKKQKAVAKPVAKEVPQKKLKTSHSNLRTIEPRIRAQPIVPHYDVHMAERSSTNAELVQLLREQASWRPSHASLSNSPIDIRYSNAIPGRKRQFSMPEADPLYSESTRYPYSRLDASFPVASSSHSVVRPSGLTSSLGYRQQNSGYPLSSPYGARNYLSDIEIERQLRRR